MTASSPESNLRDALIACSTYRTWLGVLSTGSASAMTFLPWVTEAQAAAAGDKYAIIGANENQRLNRVAQNAVALSGTLPLQFEEAVGAESEENELRDFTDTVRAIVADLLNTSEGGGYIILRDIQAHGQPTRMVAEEGDQDEIYVAQYDVDWGLEG